MSEVEELEYGIQTPDVGNNQWAVIPQYLGNSHEQPYWGELEEREAYLDDLHLDYPDRTFMLVKRRKAGPVEIV